MSDLQTPLVPVPSLIPVQPHLATLHALYTQLSGLLLERDETLRAALIALLTGQHLVLLGPPGTAKSLLVTLLAERITAGAGQVLNTFLWLLTRYTTPDELFGPISVQGLKQDVYRRITTGKLPEAHLVFLDEVFKANSAVLNALLTVLNERAFDNGTTRQPVPLLTLFGASNEMPQGDDLSALWDRFALRHVVEYVSDSAFARLLRLAAQNTPPVTLSLSDLQTLQSTVKQIPIPDTVLDALLVVRKELAGKGIVISDRRWRQSLDLIRAHALLEARAIAEEDDLIILQHSLWTQPDQQQEIARMVARLANPLNARAIELSDQAADVHRKAMDAQRSGTAEENMHAAIEGNTKLKAIRIEISRIKEQLTAQARNTTRADRALGHVQKMQREIAELIL